MVGDEGVGDADEGAVKFHHEAFVDQGDAAVGMGDGGASEARDQTDRVVEFLSGEPEVDVATFAGIGGGVEAGHGEAFLDHGVESGLGEERDQLGQGGAHLRVAGLDGVDAGHPAGQERSGGEQGVGEAAEAVVAGAADGLAFGHVIDALPFLMGEIPEEGAVGRLAVESPAEEFYECVVGGRHRGRWEREEFRDES